MRVGFIGRSIFLIMWRRINDVKVVRRGANISFLLLTFLLPLYTGPTLASSCSGGGQTFTITMPSTVSVPRDAAVGTPLTSWMYSSASSGLYSCSASNDALGIRGVVVNFMSSTGLTVAAPSGGAAINVYQTNIPGVGIARAGSLYNSYSGWSTWNGFTTSYDGPVWVPLSGRYTLGAQVAVMLVKTGTISSGGTILGSTVVNVAPYTSGGQTSQIDSYSITPIQINILSCSVNNVPVDLGVWQRSRFVGIGTTTDAKPVNIKISCQGGLGLVRYSISNVTTIINGSQSVVALDGSSSASGVGVQLLNSAGTSAFPLNTITTFSGYAGAGSYTINLNARYYQTSVSVLPGTANSSLYVNMVYQ